MKSPRIILIALSIGFATVNSSAQVTLSGTAYSQDFDSLGSSLPSGWTVYTNATSTTFGTGTTIVSATTSWATGGSSAGSDFRNVSSDNITYTTTGATQAANTDRALGWRSISGSAADTRDGAAMVSISNTSGFENFSLSVDLFTISLTGGSQTYDLEYRVGSSGAFTQIGSTITTPDASAGEYSNQTTITANPVTLSAMNDQSESVYFRLRGTTTAGTSNLDIIAIDNFALSFSATAVPEPSSFAAMAGLAMLGFAASRRRRREQFSATSA